MKDMGEQLFITQVSGGPSSLTTAPKPPNSNRATRPDRQETQALLYQGSEAEAGPMAIAACVQCKGVHRVPPQDLKKGTGQSQKEDKYVCLKCSFHTAPARFPFNNPSATHVGNEAETISSPVNKFKVRNFKPGKYYCDKCRFSTKDPLQYKKHTLQHEEIKFICSHCSCISYTKGEFQRHLVKHTGVFPYRCEYCDYGAIRNDYIVKHRRRVHERAGAKRPLKTVAKLEPKRTNISKQTMEILKAPSARTIPHSKLSDQLSRFSLHTSRDRTNSIVLLPEVKELQKDVVCVPNKVTLSAQHELSVSGSKNVHVEVVSPTKEPVQPGVPLTVMAPAELVVPTNCLAQLMDVKVVNGTQQLVLKLFPLEENARLGAGSGDGAKSEPRANDKGLDGQRKILPAPKRKSLMIEGNVGDLVGMDHLQSSVQKQLKHVKWVRPYDVFVSSSAMYSQRESFLGSDPSKELQKNHSVYAPRAALPTVPFKGGTPASGDKSSALHGAGAVPSPLPCKAAVCSDEDRRHLPSDPQRLLPLALSPTTISHSGEEGLFPVESRSKISISEKTVSPQRKLEVAENKAVSSITQVSSAHKNEYLHINITGQDGLRSQQLGEQPVQLRNAERTDSTFDGPVISSVFSLSSGSENVPEGIKWNSSTTKIKSIELLRKKIAQLIESCGKPSPVSPANSAHRRSVGPVPKLAPKPAPEGIREISVSLTDPCPSVGPLQKPQHEEGVTGSGQLAQPQRASGSDGETEGRVMRKSQVSAPVLIPKGAVLRVLNSSEDAHIVEATCDPPVNIPCSKAQIPEPIPSSPGRQAGSDLKPLPDGSEPADMSPSLETPLGPKPRKEEAACNTVKKMSPVPAGPPGGSDPSKQGRLLCRGLTVDKKKAKQVGSAKKKSKMQADASRCLKDPSMFQVARQLRLIAAKPDQLIKCPRRNQPVIVLNHPDVDSPEVTNVMKVINKYKGNVLKVVLSERTRCQLGVRRHPVRLTCQNVEEANQMKRQLMLKMKLRKVHKNNYQVVGSLPEDSSQCLFKCWFCGRLYEDQEEWMSHGQRHLIEATRDWDVLSSKGK